MRLVGSHPEAAQLALTEEDLAGKIPDGHDQPLMFFAIDHLTLYMREIGGSTHLEELLNNVGAWPRGYNAVHDVYWAVPKAEGGFYVRGVGGGTAVFKWSGNTFRGLLSYWQDFAFKKEGEPAAPASGQASP